LRLIDFSLVFFSTIESNALSFFEGLPEACSELTVQQMGGFFWQPQLKNRIEVALFAFDCTAFFLLLHGDE
jgi:hypothetical protein